ncbi:MAG: glycine--tRNA ligase subunit beta [Streptococcaceae bacterium]|jgi:glycyl-tRNA synthetase beta chain|nr:glycine--tRNA ligase subunit beta [Streptococcaceae bacterium]
MSNYLLEIGLEEVPAHLVTPSVDQLEERMATFLEDHAVKFERIIKFSTPRRLAVLVEGLSELTEASDEEVKGPSAKIAKDTDGNWTKAIEGFSRGQGLTPDDLVLKGDYYFAQKHIAGQPVADVLTAVGTDVVEKMTFSTYMKWGNESLLYVRPIQWLVSLLDSKVVPFQILDVVAGRNSRGHRFLANNEQIPIVAAHLYDLALERANVIAYAPARKMIIAQQIFHIADDKGWAVELHDDLLEEVNNIVEYPTAFYGKFDAKYLEVPAEVLITSMRDNQRYFEVYDAAGHLQPNFVSVRDGNVEHIENVIAGNEKVLIARLEDAKFFWEEDQKLSIDDLVAKLQNVTFHAKIGSLSEHMARVKVLALELAEKLNLKSKKSDIERVAAIYKFDLLTGMVDEFDELQGVMGEKYARLSGEPEAVSVAIREHYMPTSAEGDLPETELGALLAVADKLDSVKSFFAAGLIPSGSNDPYALRRATTGIIRILEKFGWHVDWADLTDSQEILDFTLDRVKKMAQDRGLRFDFIEAALAQPVFDVVNMLEMARILDSHKGHPPFKTTMEAVTRVNNILSKNHTDANVDESLFQEAEETVLYQALQPAKASFASLSLEDKFRTTVHTLAAPINAYFEAVMVLADDEKQKANHLALLQEVANLTSQLGDLSKVNTKDL